MPARRIVWLALEKLRIVSSLQSLNSDAASGALSLRAVVRFAALVLLVLTAPIIGTGGELLSVRYFRTQDGWVIGLAFVVLLLAIVVPPRWRAAGMAWPPVRRAWVLPAMALLALVLWWGSYAVMSGYALTRDEHMVLFDMAVFRQGRLAEPLDPFWRDHVRAVVPDFRLEIPGQPVLVSAYLPVNAMLRAAFAALADPAFMNPLLAALAGLAFISIARRLFPEERATQWAAILMFFASAQLLVAAMTPYAMTAHLAANLCWLALFLRGGRLGHGGALLLGFAAMGLHQVIFHPLFALPFLLWRWRRGEWRIVLFYGLAYGAYGLFWINWQTLVVHVAGVQVTSGAAAGAGGFIRQRVLPLLLEHDPLTVTLMEYNLLRFLAWQNLALLPLMLGAGQALRRGEGVVWPLAGGLLLAIGAFAFLLPYQGHGWGYRYLHGFLGSAALLGAYGFRGLAAREPRGTYLLLLGGTALTLALATPFLLWRAHDFVMPHARADAMLSRIEADHVVIDTDVPGYQVDLVRNLPDLAQRPIRLASSYLDATMLEALCARGSVTFADRALLGRLGVETGIGADHGSFSRLQASLAGRHCGAPNPVTR